VRKVTPRDVGVLRGRRRAAEDAIAVGMAAEGGDDLADVSGLFHQRSVDRLQLGRGFGSDALTESDEEIDALEVVGPSQWPSGWVAAILNHGVPSAR